MEQKKMLRSIEDLKILINEVFNDIDAGYFYKDRMYELNNIFTAQLSSLDKVRQLGFFTVLTDKFWSAFSAFLDLAKLIESEDTDYLIRESYTFIKSFDNALQGYLNSDRQFLEFPGHSVSLYDLPAKLGVVYIHLIDNVINAFKDNESKEVEYLLCPEPFDEEGVHVSRLLSLIENKSPNFDLFIIEAPSRMMFQPDKLLFALSHEIAHYAGRSHRVFNSAAIIDRNKVMFEIHRVALARECIFGLKKTFEDDYYNKPNASLLNGIMKCKARFELEGSNVQTYCPDNLTEVDQEATFTKMEELLKDGYADPFLPTIDECVHRDIEIASPFSYLDAEAGKLFANKKYLIVSNIKSGIEHVHRFALYIIKEGVADALAIKLLDVKLEDYQDKMKAERDKVLGNTNLEKAITMREAIVCKACFGKDFGRSSLGKDVDTILVNFVEKVYCAYKPDDNNIVRDYYKKALDKSEPGDMLLSFLL